LEVAVGHHKGLLLGTADVVVAEVQVQKVQVDPLELALRRV
jgi:hypothetical protein